MMSRFEAKKDDLLGVCGKPLGELEGVLLTLFVVLKLSLPEVILLLALL